METQEELYNKNILVAVDESDNSRRAVSYVGQLLGGYAEFKVTLLHVIPVPDEDTFSSKEEEERWLEKHTRKMDVALEDYRQILIRWGFKYDDIFLRSPLRYCPSMAECILAEKGDTRYSTVVVGRQGLSRSKEFVFGSISNKIVTYARNCTVWVVE